MSYILDALRRADAERRGAIAPGELTAPGVLSDDDDLPRPLRPLRWLFAGIGLAALVWAAWAWLSPTPPPLAPPILPIDTPLPPALATAPPAVPVPVPAPAPAFTSQPTAPFDTAPAVVGAPITTPHAATGAEPLPPALAALANAAPPPTAKLRPSATAVPPGTAAAAKPADLDRPLPTFAELPDTLRRDLPALTVGGAMYSERASDRMLIVNGVLVHEGDALARGVVLRQIRLKEAVMEFRGQRYVVRY